MGYLQCLINNMPHDMLRMFVITYINKILIYSPDKEMYVVRVKQVLAKLLTNQLCVRET